MRIKEVSKRFNVSITALRYYEKVGLFEDVNRVNGIREYEDKDIERLSLILTLKNIGLSNETILKYIELNEQGAHTKKQQIQVLKLERQKLLDSIHNQQKNIDSLDYLIYQLKDKEKIKPVSYTHLLMILNILFCNVKMIY